MVSLWPDSAVSPDLSQSDHVSQHPEDQAKNRYNVLSEVCGSSETDKLQTVIDLQANVI